MPVARRPEQWPVGRNKLAQFRHRGSAFAVGLPELRKLVPAYGPLASETLYPIKSTVPCPLESRVCRFRGMSNTEQGMSNDEVGSRMTKLGVE